MTLRRLTSVLALGGALLLAPGPLAMALAAPAPAAKVMSQLPQVSGPIPVTATSRPFLGAVEVMDAAGYVEEEYFLSGQANVYDWVGATRDLKVVAGPGKYVTRILIRRPRDPSKFSGNVEVMLLNATTGVDLGGPIDVKRMVRQGDVWVGITTKSLTANALKKFDPVRYAPLDWTNPLPAAQRCEYPSIIPLFMIGGEAAARSLEPAPPSADEDGLVWDMLGQLGVLLKSEDRHKILPGFGKPTVYMVGISQSAINMRTWFVGFHDRYRTADGRPVYDGYLAIVGPGVGRLNQCSSDVPLADSRHKFLPPPKVPFISLSSEGEMWIGAYTHQPDVVSPKGGIVTYEVAGSSHARVDVPELARGGISAAKPDDAAKAGIRPDGTVGLAPSGTVKNDLIWAPVVRGAYHNLQLWVRQGTIPPQAPGIAVDANHAVKRDQYGNALGGLRTPYIEAPTATHTGFLTAGGYGGMTGSKKPFSAETLKALYPDHAAYVAKFSAATDKLVAGRWISAEDAAAMKGGAEAAPVP